MSETTYVAPEWIDPALRRMPGLDPLGFQTATQDRLMPLLLPDVLELTRRARYLAFYAFLLAEYQQMQGPPSRDHLSAFIKTREYDLGLAVLRCPHCQSGPVGAERLRPALAGDPEMFERDESVQSPNGGYGLYYRSPMIGFDAVVPAGTPLGEEPTPIDVLSPREAARTLAATFRAAVEGTDYYRRFFRTADPLPRGVVDEYAEVACLCRITDDERDVLEQLVFEPSTDVAAADAAQRRWSVAHYLSLLADEPDVAASDSAFRAALWAPATVDSEAHAAIADQWAALVAKDLAQDAVCSVWTHLLRDGLAAGGLDGLDRTRLREVVRGMCDGPPLLDPDVPAETAVAAVDRPRANAESLRRWVAEADTANAGLVGLVGLTQLIVDRASRSWRELASVASAWQPSVHQIATEVNGRLTAGQRVEDMLWWLTQRFVISAHERIAYSKLPDFTFRFRSEPEGLRFYDFGTDRFRLAGIRHTALGSLTADLGYWQKAEGTAVLTGRGAAFVNSELR